METEAGGLRAGETGSFKTIIGCIYCLQKKVILIVMNVTYRENPDHFAQTFDSNVCPELSG